ncbi:hypothetical protein GGP41_005203 [Bipolaris sorokiniana]|uniref:Uncharacterized protein n=2 Tax=Cochliobolus sativus TaxID=45130 RepID=A0A8H5ZK59_COCSA|nr:uncharacterized protein COCSADRAFT_27629 [Bipolaris sorokiniana ND90Pr]EMD63186.1 hypothetical protein COCSADRAFT_27629 [Bipolaris sorokiniana ND90Pr]KAF5849724.1 hypothetical protein GGP41_005203 [Bipolaris sorokiniana]
MFLTLPISLSLFIISQICHAVPLITPRGPVTACPSHRLYGSERTCIPYVEKKDIAGISFNLYTWTVLDSPNTPAGDSSYLAPLVKAAEDVLPFYATLMKSKMKTINAFLTEEFEYSGITDFLSMDPDICSVRVGNRLPLDNGSIQKTLAHELYHCVQRTFEPIKPFTESEWWSEGLAEYFGNVFFPGTNGGHMPSYNPRAQLWRNTYGASVFFQHLSGTVSDVDIHNWGIVQPDLSSWQDLEASVSRDNFIINAFPSFAAQFADGKITYKNKQTVVAKIPTSRYLDNIPPKPGVYTRNTRLGSFAVLEKLELTLPKNRKISFRFDTQDSQTVLQYRKASEQNWSTAKKGVETLLEQGTCEYVFLATSTSHDNFNQAFNLPITFTVKKVSKKHKHKRDDVGNAILAGIQSGGIAQNSSVTSVTPVTTATIFTTLTIVTTATTVTTVTAVATAATATSADQVTPITPVTPTTPATPDPSVVPDIQGAAEGANEQWQTIFIDDSEPYEDDQEGSSCENQCLIGNWHLDVPSMQSFLAQKIPASVAAQAPVTITNLAVTGSSTFSVTSSLASSWIIDHLDISYDATADDLAFHALMDITGSLDGKVKLSGDDMFSWENIQSTGAIKTTTTVFGIPLELDIPLSQQYGASTQVQYICEGDTLQMAGYVDGGYQWGYTWSRDVIV